MIIRTAHTHDAEAICKIANPLIENTTVTFTTELKTVETVANDIAAREGAFLVAETGGVVLGFATYFPFRSGPGYAAAKEHSINLAPEARGKGAGRALMDALEEHARRNGVHSFCAAVSGENQDAITFHEKVGFKTVGTIPQSGRKFERWIDLIFMQKILR
ncbi:N-acetyltransferase family protein [Planktotalea sp.]|uniref:GNAT family N-acetyltransferase n=1 Tax=Planktotalea sp. TaxID=2029877 RepID=UPI0032982EE3